MFTTPPRLFCIALASVVAAYPVVLFKRDISPAVVPPFGIVAGTNPDGTGNCDGVTGANGKPVLIPCACPPPEDQFLAALNANVNAGHAVNNPTVQVTFPADNDNTTAAQIERINAILITLQNLHGPGVGCPAASTDLLAQEQALQAGKPVPAPSPASSSSASAPTSTATVSSTLSTAAASTIASAPAASSSSVNSCSSEGTDDGDEGSEDSDPSIASLAPSLGFTSGQNPTGTGDCDGAVKDASGNPIKVPCSCPPPQDEYISQLEANVAAGHAIHNPSVSVSFPLDNSTASQRSRIEAAIVTIQNLNGVGQGCPAASTTLSAQLAAVQG